MIIRYIGFESNSPILDENLQVEAKLLKLAEDTDQKIIKYKLSKWEKYRKCLTYSNIACAVVLSTTMYLMTKHMTSF